jgi:hypothetical protein
MRTARIILPKTAKRGEVIEIRTLISHIMETGFRHGTNGQSIPRDIITSLTVRYNGEEIFRMDVPGRGSEPVRRVHHCRNRNRRASSSYGQATTASSTSRRRR